ncbi:hypothetical protein JOM56_014990 [Amanita muscaria]
MDAALKERGWESDSQRVQELFASSRYIYPVGANGVSIQYHKPFENSAVIGTLRDDLFLKNISIVTKYPLRFRVTDYEPEPNKLSQAMIALAATAVFAALKEWELGHRVQTHFTTNLFESIYQTHIKHLQRIEALNARGYHTMLLRLFRRGWLRLHSENVQAEDFNLTDVQNMVTDI